MEKRSIKAIKKEIAKVLQAKKAAVRKITRCDVRLYELEKELEEAQHGEE